MTTTENSGTLQFTVDAKLLEELGERLIGKPYIALAELVKNSYDADATSVTIQLDKGKEQIVVADNGHGMTFEEFNGFWMRIGSRHKEELRTSKNFEREMTGSKGVGRLAVQYLADMFELETVSQDNPSTKLHAKVRWSEAVKAKELVKAKVAYTEEESIEGSQAGTRIVLSDLKQVWEEKDIQGLAQEIWWLRPPFRPAKTELSKEASQFEIQFLSQADEYIRIFEKQMEAITNIWHAKIVGANNHGKVDYSLEFKDEPVIRDSFTIENCLLEGGSFEVRIYALHRGRPPGGLRTGEIRYYLERFGGVHVYDSGFHLPYYGDPRNDWLKIEIDHSHRLSASGFLPDTQHVPEGMNFLPTLSRILGIVNVNTAEDRALQILITRDRLQENRAFQQLIEMIRHPIDFYAMEEAKRRLEETEAKPAKMEKLEDVLTKHKSEIPSKVYQSLKADLAKASEEIQTEAERTAKQVGILGSLASAVISNEIIEHELRQQFVTVEDIVEKLGKVRPKDPESGHLLSELQASLRGWMERVRSTFELFANLADPENISKRQSLPAKDTIEKIWEQMRLLTMGVELDTFGLDKKLSLPSASYAEWVAIFQNVFLNAVNAIDAKKDATKRVVSVSSQKSEGETRVLVEDTGIGLDPKEAKRLFKPFERRMALSQQRRRMGFGGSGLGLTIVRVVSSNLGCKVSFVEPSEGFKTAFLLEWSELD